MFNNFTNLSFTWFCQTCLVNATILVHACHIKKSKIYSTSLSFWTSLLIAFKNQTERKLRLQATPLHTASFAIELYSNIFVCPKHRWSISKKYPLKQKQKYLFLNTFMCWALKNNWRSTELRQKRRNLGFSLWSKQTISKTIPNIIYLVEANYSRTTNYV